MNALLKQVSDLLTNTYLNNTIVTPIAIILFLVVVYSKIVNLRKTKLANRIPGPDGLFFVGMLPLLLEGPEKLLTNALKIFREYEKSLFKVWVLDNLYICLTKPEDVETVLTNSNLFKKSKEYKVVSESILGDGIFSNTNFDEWKKNRKLVAAGFKFSIVKSFIPIFNEEAKILSELLYEKRDIDLNDCEISDAIGMATMEMIGRTALGVKFDAQKNANHVFIENLHVVQKVWEYRFTHPWFLRTSLFHLSSFKRKHDVSQRKIYDFTKDLIEKKHAELKSNVNNQGEHNEESIGFKPKSLIEILLENGHLMSFNQIRDEIITVMFGGQDTTAMANACTIFMLAHHQDIQNKVFEELWSILSSGDSDRQLSYDDLQSMDYLECVIKETLRLFCIVPFLTKDIEKEVVIGDYSIPAGSTLAIFTAHLHLNPQIYPEPEKFNPDNFLPEASRNRHPYSFIPFSAGYRNCIGIKYAMLQMKTTISTLVRSYRFHPSDKCPKPENLRFMFAGTLKFVNGCYVKIEPRT
ncbi:cytochrome P450 4C1-like isoform X2 [Adelges cooleyi]|uniref:cytochrome P450 4C1-like isoform X2 n=1 Tax=Adelges cooleyi TaxID=133065 RepID=UPI00218070F6|nr:cytochrome P450 4C1-like isoform X2 [Adelges cooleyi]